VHFPGFHNKGEFRENLHEYMVHMFIELKHIEAMGIDSD
jgi:hypothetical protein